MFLTRRNDRYQIGGGDGGGDGGGGGEYYYHKTRTICVWEEYRGIRCVSMMRGSFSSSVSLRQERQRERRMTRQGSILLPSTSVLDSDEWRPAFSELSRSEVPLSFLTYFWTTSDVVPLINGELESFSLR